MIAAHFGSIGAVEAETERHPRHAPVAVVVLEVQKRHHDLLPQMSRTCSLVPLDIERSRIVDGQRRQFRHIVPLASWYAAGLSCRPLRLEAGALLGDLVEHLC